MVRKLFIAIVLLLSACGAGEKYIENRLGIPQPVSGPPVVSAFTPTLLAFSAGTGTGEVSVTYTISNINTGWTSYTVISNPLGTIQTSSSVPNPGGQNTINMRHVFEYYKSEFSTGQTGSFWFCIISRNSLTSNTVIGSWRAQ